MKLYEIPRESKIKTDCFNSKNEKIGDMITFHHLDGMYSYCTVDGVEDVGNPFSEDTKVSNVVNLSGNTPLKLVGNYCEIDSET